jgi:hypothetical protein
MQVCVDMGEPILRAADVPTTLEPTQARHRCTLHGISCACSDQCR